MRATPVRRTGPVSELIFLLPLYEENQPADRAGIYHANINFGAKTENSE